MGRRLYELAGADEDLRFSPYCWRVRLALHLKGLSWDGVPWRFTDKEAIAFAGTDRVPVLVDGDRVVHDSWTILGYLEDAYPDRASLFGGAAARAQAPFFRHWTERVLQAGIVPLIAYDLHARVHARDRDYFRETREARFGATLENLAAERPRRLPAFQRTLAPLRATLEERPFLGGDEPRMPDLLVHAALLWVRYGSDLDPVADLDPLPAWRARLDAAFAGA